MRVARALFGLFTMSKARNSAIELTTRHVHQAVLKRKFQQFEVILRAIFGRRKSRLSCTFGSVCARSC